MGEHVVQELMFSSAQGLKGSLASPHQPFASWLDVPTCRAGIQTNAWDSVAHAAPLPVLVGTIYALFHKLSYVHHVHSCRVWSVSAVHHL